MILGIGTDIIEVERIAQKINKNQGFAEFVFSPKEIAYCNAKAQPYQHYAARFAAKEAFFKALGTGWANDTLFNEVEVVNDENGKPFIQLLNTTAKSLTWLRAYAIHLSMSHVKNMAIAYVIIEKKMHQI